MAKKKDDANNGVLNTAYKYRIYPNREQREYFAKCFGCARFVYNQLLERCSKHYEETGKHKVDSYAELKKDNPWRSEVDSNVLNYAKLQLKTAYDNFFKHNTGKPRFKSKKDNHQTFTTYRDKRCANVDIENGNLKIPKLNSLIKMKMHRPLMDNCSIQTVTISKTPSGRYYASILVRYENQVLPIIPAKFIGLDYAMAELYVDSEGNGAHYPKYLHKMQKKLAREQRRLSRKLEANIKKRDTLGRPIFHRPLDECKNFQKQKHKIAVLHEKIANQRADFLHKTAYRLVSEYDVIAIEDISVKDMAKRKKGRKFSFGKSVGDNGWGMFTAMLAYKLEWQGKQLVKVDKWYPSSKTCRFCGEVNTKLKLSDRKWTCPHCGATIEQRDVNAAINIKQYAIKNIQVTA